MTTGISTLELAARLLLLPLRSHVEEPYAK